MTGATSGGTHVEKTTSFGAARAAGLARVASRKLAVLSEATRNAVLVAAAKRREENAARIVSANAGEVGDAPALVRAGERSGRRVAGRGVSVKTGRQRGDKAVR